MVIDTQASPSPLVDKQDAIAYVRSPWGRSVSEGRRQFSLTGAAGALEGCQSDLPVAEGEACGSVLVFASETVSSDQLLGSSMMNQDGSFDRFLLVEADEPVIYVAAADAAGNVSDADPDREGSQAIAVRDVIWIASFGGKEANSTVNNPHRIVQTPDFRPTLEQDTVRSLG